MRDGDVQTDKGVSADGGAPVVDAEALDALLAEESRQEEEANRRMLEKDIDVQIETVVSHAMNHLMKKFPGEKFTVIARDFTTFPEIEDLQKFYSPKFLKNTSNLIPGLVIERYAGETISALGMIHSLKKMRMDYEKYGLMLQKLRPVPLIQKLDEHTIMTIFLIGLSINQMIMIIFLRNLGKNILDYFGL